MTHESEYDDFELDAEEAPEIDRGSTGVRILLTLLFFVVARVVEAALVVLIVFELAFALFTERRPSETVRRFANQTLSYLVEIGRYLTYNADAAPFPFREFPPELDFTRTLRDAGPENDA